MIDVVLLQFKFLVSKKIIKKNLQANQTLNKRRKI